MLEKSPTAAPPVPPVLTPAPPRQRAQPTVKASGRNAISVRRERRNNWLKLLAFIILAGGGAAAVVFLRPQAEQRVPNVLKVERKSLDVVLSELGSIETLVQQKVVSRITGEFSWKIEEGKFVKAGDPVAEFESTTIKEDIENREKDLLDKKDAVRRAQADIDTAIARYKLLLQQKEIDLKIAEIEKDVIFNYPTPDERLDVELSMKSAERELRKFEVEMAGYDELVKRGFATEASWRKKQLDMATKKANFAKAKLIHDLTVMGSTDDAKRVYDLALADAKKQLSVTQFNRDADIAFRQASLELAQVDFENFDRELKKRKQQLEWATLRAPTQGRVVFHPLFKGSEKSKSPAQIGESYSEGNDLCTICDTNQLRIKVWINESDIGGVTVGQKARVTMSAFPGRAFKARVTAIGVSAIDKNVALSDLAVRRSGEAFVNVVETKLEFEGLSVADRDEIRVGFTAAVQLEARETTPVLTVPWAGVMREDDGKYFAEVQLADGKSERRALRLGRSDGERVEVIEGLKENEVLLDQAIPFQARQIPAAGGAK